MGKCLREGMGLSEPTINVLSIYPVDSQASRQAIGLCMRTVVSK